MSKKEMFGNSDNQFLKRGVKRTGATVLLSTKNPEDAFDFYNRGQEHNDEVFTYFPETTEANNENKSSRTSTKILACSLFDIFNTDGVERSSAGMAA